MDMTHVQLGMMLYKTKNMKKLVQSSHSEFLTTPAGCKWLQDQDTKIKYMKNAIAKVEAAEEAYQIWRRARPPSPIQDDAWARSVRARFRADALRPKPSGEGDKAGGGEERDAGERPAAGSSAVPHHCVL